MLVLLKLTGFGLWLAMMMCLILAVAADKAGGYGGYRVTLCLADPQRAEHEIKSALGRLPPQARLCLEISTLNPDLSELLFIASRLQRTNPSLIIFIPAANAVFV